MCAHNTRAFSLLIYPSDGSSLSAGRFPGKSLLHLNLSIGLVLSMLGGSQGRECKAGIRASLLVLVVKNPPASVGDTGLNPHPQRSPHVLQGSQARVLPQLPTLCSRVLKLPRLCSYCNSQASSSPFVNTPWALTTRYEGHGKRATPVFLPGESHGQRGAWRAAAHGVAKSRNQSPLDFQNPGSDPFLENY